MLTRWSVKRKPNRVPQGGEEMRFIIKCSRHGRWLAWRFWREVQECPKCRKEWRADAN